jgi:hypothetical protein
LRARLSRQYPAVRPRRRPLPTEHRKLNTENCRHRDSEHFKPSPMATQNSENLTLPIFVSDEKTGVLEQFGTEWHSFRGLANLLNCCSTLLPRAFDTCRRGPFDSIRPWRRAARRTVEQKTTAGVLHLFAFHMIVCSPLSIIHCSACSPAPVFLGCRMLHGVTRVSNPCV